MDKSSPTLRLPSYPRLHAPSALPRCRVDTVRSPLQLLPSYLFAQLSRWWR